MAIVLCCNRVNKVFPFRFCFFFRLLCILKMKRIVLWTALCLGLFLLASLTVNAMEDSAQEEDSSEVKPQTTSSTSRTRYRRALSHDDDEDDEDDDEDDDDERRHASRPFIRRRRPRPSGNFKSALHPLKPCFVDSSSSLTQLRGVLRIVVIGNGDMCFVKIFQRRYSYRAQYGDTTSTSAFLNLYGHGECERKEYNSHSSLKLKNVLL